MPEPVRVMIEQGKKKRVVACAFDWPGWDRSARLGGDVLAVLAAYRPRYARVAELAGLRAELAAAGELEVTEQVDGTGMTDFYGVSGRTATPEHNAMTDLQFLIRRCAWHMLDHAWELEDRDLSGVRA